MSDKRPYIADEDYNELNGFEVSLSKLTIEYFLISSSVKPIIGCLGCCCCWPCGKLIIYRNLLLAV